MAEEKKEEKKVEIVKEESRVGVPPKEIPLQKLVWRETPEPKIHVVRGHVVKLDNNFLHFKGLEKESLLIIPIKKIEEIK